MPFGSGPGANPFANNLMYEAEVNKKSLNMNSFTTTLNARWRNGWELDKAFEQDGNTVVVWKRRDPVSLPPILPREQFPAPGWYDGPEGPKYYDGTNWQ